MKKINHLLSPLALLLLAACYPDNDKIFEQYGSALRDTTTTDTVPDDPLPDVRYPYVDLGLSSRVLWAEHNVGASQSSEKGTDFKYSPYTATNEWGSPWTQPSTADFQALIDECTWEAATLDGVEGYKATGPNENTLFFPSVPYWTNTAIAGSPYVFTPSATPRVDKGYYSFNNYCYVRAVWTTSTDSLELSQNNIAISEEKQTQEIPFFSTRRNVSATTDATWVAASVSGSKIRLTYEENTTSDQRTAKIFVQAGPLKRKLTLLQDAPNNSLTLSKDRVSFTHKGGTKTVNVTTDGEYKAEGTDDAWLTVAVQGNTITLTAVPNSTLAAKEAYVNVTTGSREKKITVLQSSASQTPEATITSLKVSDDKVEIKGSIDAYDAAIEEYGVIYTKSSSSTPPELTLDSWKGKSRGKTSKKQLTFNVTFNGNGYWYGNKDYFFFRAYVIATDGYVYYSDISKGVIPTSRQ